MAAHGDDGRGVLDGGERLGIVRLAMGDEPGTEPFEALELALGRRDGTDLEGARSSAPAGEFGQRVQRRRSGAEAL